jgi:hypothetical protein
LTFERHSNGFRTTFERFSNDIQTVFDRDFRLVSECQALKIDFLRRPLLRGAEHEVNAALVVQVDVPGRVAGLPAPDAGVEVEPLPRVTSGHLTQFRNS